jgi:hypothetical protein
MIEFFIFWVSKLCLGWMTYLGKVENQHHVIKSWQQKMKESGRTVQPVINCWVSQSVIGG